MRNRAQHRLAAGFSDPLVLLGVVVAAGLLWATASNSPAPDPAPAPPPAATPGANVRYEPYVFLDQVTGCEYLSTHTSTGLAPRIAADGKTHMGCKESAR